MGQQRVSGSPVLVHKVQKMEGETTVLGRKLKVMGIGWQRRPVRRWLTDLLANEQAVSLPLKYLMGMGVGGWNFRHDK